MKTLPLSEMKLNLPYEIAGICFDLDDTFTSDARISTVAWSALWNAYNAGIAMIPVTGRPAGWCDLICRFWPVAGVVGENGAFYFSYDPQKRQVIRKFAVSSDKRKSCSRRFEEIKKDVLKAVPGAAISADQPFRIADLAIDFAEDTGPLSEVEISEIVKVMQLHGMTVKVSSIHVNGWFGDYDKADMLMLFARDRLGLTEDEALRKLIYVGDSPNDAPLFKLFPFSVGVSNVRKFLSEMKDHPAYITEKPEGDGFAELIDTILLEKNKSCC